MKKMFLAVVVTIIIIVLGVIYYNENIKTNTITDGTFVWKGNEQCG